MNPHVWWHVARAAGITSWMFGATSVATGLAMGSKATLRPRPNWQLDLHRNQAGLSLAALALHLAALVADSYSRFTLAALTIPMASAWKPGAVATGIVAMYLLIAVQTTSWARRRLPVRWWRAVHRSSLIAYLLSTAHFLQAGTDHRRLPALLAIVAVTGINLGLLTFRLLAAPRRHAAAVTAAVTGPRHVTSVGS